LVLHTGSFRLPNCHTLSFILPNPPTGISFGNSVAGMIPLAILLQA